MQEGCCYRGIERKRAVTITSTATLPTSSTLIYEGGNYICMEGGFVVTGGADAAAYIKNFPVT